MKKLRAVFRLIFADEWCYIVSDKNATRYAYSMSNKTLINMTAEIHNDAITKSHELAQQDANVREANKLLQNT